MRTLIPTETDPESTTMGDHATQAAIHDMLEDLDRQVTRAGVLRRALRLLAADLAAREGGGGLAVVGPDGAVVRELARGEG